MQVNSIIAKIIKETVRNQIKPGSSTKLNSKQNFSQKISCYHHLCINKCAALPYIVNKGGNFKEELTEKYKLEL